MKRLAAMVGTGFATVALSAGTAFAGCPQPGGFPEADGWYVADSTEVHPKGAACDVAVKIIIKGHQRDRVNGEAVPEDFKPKLGDRLVLESPDMTMTLVNQKNGKKVTKKISGTFYDKVVDFNRDGKLDLKSKGVGKNVFYGAGVKGILWADGVQKFRVDNFTGFPDSELHIDKTKGKTTELCNKIGAKAVHGKNILPPEPQP
jgi:hypothetical protein